jgi:hypothetical protein
VAPWVSDITVDATKVDAPGTLTFSHLAITDDSGNTLVRVATVDNIEQDCLTGALLNDADLLNDEIEPCFYEVYGVLGLGNLFYNSWSAADATSSADIGRYFGAYEIQHGNLAEYGFNAAGYFFAVDRGPGWYSWWTDGVAIEPADVNFNTDWAYHYILTMYEFGMTAGTSATTYSPYGDVSRAQMATYLANPFMNANVALFKGDLPLVLALPTYAGGFTDVAVGDWYANPVQFMIDNGITAGVGGGLYGSTWPVIRGDMAIFLEKSGRAADNIAAWNWSIWNTDLGTPFGMMIPNTPGMVDGWFVDIAADDYYGPWAEEALVDGLIFPCAYGEPWINLSFCPTRVVDRSEMAAFMVNTFLFPLGAFPAPGFWGGPVPVPDAK